MTKNILRGVIAVLGAILGLGTAEVVNTMLRENGSAGMLFSWMPVLIYVVLGLLFGIIFFFLSSPILKLMSTVLRSIEKRLASLTLVDIFFCVIGLIIGLVIAVLFSTLIAKLPGSVLPFLINAVLYLLFAYLGVSLVYRRRHDIKEPSWFKRSDKSGQKSSAARPKVMDTSAIIDGRVYDICKAGFLEGDLIVPRFVLDELRHISDSTDAQKRKRGRRGLDILKHLQDDDTIPVTVRVDDRDYESIQEVDAKLLKMATELHGVVVTMDYNLNKVASVQNVPVLNVNDLANALKTVLLPGDEIQTLIVQEGKEQGQGLAYLDDGTMIVVDGGKAHIGKNLSVCVTSVLQTSAGKMIFAKIA